MVGLKLFGWTSQVLKMLFFFLTNFVLGTFYRKSNNDHNGLPRSYIVKQRQDQLNDICHITCTPGTAEGEQILFSDLLKERLRDYLESHPDGHEHTRGSKISEDGARMTRKSSFIFFWPVTWEMT